MLKKQYFLTINKITIGSVIVLILIGSIVRTLGAGMGCPDWPKCFGEYIPPTSEEQLPEDYLDVFRAQRLKKNKRLAKTFASLGYEQLAEKITNDPAILKEQRFDTTKAWVEYINRLVGVLIGLFVFANLLFSFSYWKENKSITLAAIAVFVLTGFQGWVGSLVVSTNLLHGFITVHMLIALAILGFLIWINVKARAKTSLPNTRAFIIASVTLVLLTIQMVLGTEVRGVIDDLIANETSRMLWIQFVETSSFFVHRSFSWLILVGTGLLYFLVRGSVLGTHSLQSLGLVVFGMLLGIGMVKFDFPAWMQFVHFLVATGLFALLFYLTLRIKFSR